jgi:hypothetical protein
MQRALIRPPPDLILRSPATFSREGRRKTPVSRRAMREKRYRPLSRLRERVGVGGRGGLP